MRTFKVQNLVFVLSDDKVNFKQQMDLQLLCLNIKKTVYDFNNYQYKDFQCCALSYILIWDVFFFTPYDL